MDEPKGDKPPAPKAAPILAQKRQGVGGRGVPMIYMDLHGSTWTSKGLHGFTWIYMDRHGLWCTSYAVSRLFPAVPLRPLGGGIVYHRGRAMPHQPGRMRFSSGRGHATAPPGPPCCTNIYLLLLRESHATPARAPKDRSGVPVTARAPKDQSVTGINGRKPVFEQLTWKYLT